MEVPPHPQTPSKQAGKRGEVEKLDRRSQGGDGGEMGLGRIFGGKMVLISTRLAEEGYWSQFLGGAFVQCGDIPLMMAGSKIQPESES